MNKAMQNDFWGDIKVKLTQMRSLSLLHFHGYLNRNRSDTDTVGDVSLNKQS